VALFVPIEVPFDGVSLPANAELRLIDPRLEPITVTLPDGTVRTLDVVRDDISATIAVPDDLQPLPLGAYGFEISGATGTFDVTEVLDDKAPDAPLVTVTESSAFTPPSLWPFEECPRNVGSHTSATFTVDGTQPGDLILLDGVAVAAGVEGTTTFTKTNVTGGSTFELKLRDAAGNKSDITTVDSGGACGSCSAVDSSFSMLFSFAALGVRRRRRMQGTGLVASSVRTSTLARLVVVVCLLALAGACSRPDDDDEAREGEGDAGEGDVGEGEGEGEGDSGDEGEGEAPPPSCIDDCRPDACFGVATCAHGNAAVGEPCSVAADCASSAGDAVCVHLTDALSFCTEGCSATDPCAQGSLCDDETGTCVRPCGDDDDCAAGFVCLHPRPGAPLRCVPGRTCGDGFASGTVCDGDDLDGATCTSRQAGDGTLACTANCDFDTSDCGSCGDGRVQSDEMCDDGVDVPGCRACKWTACDARRVRNAVAGDNAGDTTNAPPLVDGRNGGHGEVWRFTAPTSGFVRFTVLSTVAAHDVVAVDEPCRPAPFASFPWVWATAPPPPLPALDVGYGDDVQGALAAGQTVLVIVQAEPSFDVGGRAIPDFGPYTLRVEFVPDVCGDGMWSGTEACDGALVPSTCSSFGALVGVPGCSGCALDLARCTDLATIATEHEPNDDVATAPTYAEPWIGAVAGDDSDCLRVPFSSGTRVGVTFDALDSDEGLSFVDLTIVVYVGGVVVGEVGDRGEFTVGDDTVLCIGPPFPTYGFGFVAYQLGLHVG
jgi:hypothetical protein